MVVEHSSGNLPTELQAKLNFTPDSTKRWLYSDVINGRSFQVGGPHLYEILPAVARVSAEGTRYEVGVRRVDLEGLLELAKIVRPRARGADHVIKFWEGNPNVEVMEEAERIFIGVDIEPTPQGFEEKFNAPGGAFDVAISAAIQGKSYAQMLIDKWHGLHIKQIQSNHIGGRTIVFPEPEREEISCDVEPKITVNTLRKFPLESIRHGLHSAPGTIKIDDTERDFVNGSRIVVQGRDPRVLDGSSTVQITVPNTFKRTSRIGEKAPEDGLTIYLQVPEGTEIKTIEDIAQLKKTEVFTKARTKTGYKSQAMDVEVEMEDDSFRIVSADRGFELEIRKPCCPECKTPTWKFPERYDLIEDREKSSDEWGENSFLYGGGCGGGEPPKFVVAFEEDDRPYCGDCIIPVVERYKDKHPYASRVKATEFARQRLDEIGYPDVEIEEIWPESPFRYDTWDVLTVIRYPRDDREIIRYTGSPMVTHDGDFQNNMFPRKYVDFRYKTN